MVFPLSLKRILSSIVHMFLNPRLWRALLSSSIRRAIKLSVIDIPESFTFLLIWEIFSPIVVSNKFNYYRYFFHGLGFPIGLRKVNVHLIFYKTGNHASMISPLFSSILWTSIQFLLEYCSRSSLFFFFFLKFHPYHLEY